MTHSIFRAAKLLLFICLSAPNVAQAQSSTTASPTIPLSHLYLHFFLYEAHFEHLEQQHPETANKPGGFKDRLRIRAGLTKSEWAAISASSLRAEQALHTVGSQLSSLEAANRQDCKVATVNCPAALQRSSQFALLRAQRQQAVDAEAASLESVLSVESTSRLRHYLQTDFASHVQSMTLTATQVKAAKAVQR